MDRFGHHHVGLSSPAPLSDTITILCRVNHLGNKVIIRSAEFIFRRPPFINVQPFESSGSARHDRYTFPRSFRFEITSRVSGYLSIDLRSRRPVASPAVACVNGRMLRSEVKVRERAADIPFHGPQQNQYKLEKTNMKIENEQTSYGHVFRWSGRVALPSADKNPGAHGRCVAYHVFCFLFISLGVSLCRPADNPLGNPTVPLSSGRATKKPLRLPAVFDCQTGKTCQK